MNQKTNIIFLMVGTILFVKACGSKSSEKVSTSAENQFAVIPQEQRVDSLFLGFYFGMTRDDFFAHSWDLNKKKIVTNGAGAEIIKYEEAEKSGLKISFYPIFANEKIVAMPVIYLLCRLGSME